jgi:hypothetical protein
MNLYHILPYEIISHIIDYNNDWDLYINDKRFQSFIKNKFLSQNIDIINNPKIYRFNRDKIKKMDLMLINGDIVCNYTGNLKTKSIQIKNNTGCSSNILLSYNNRFYYTLDIFIKKCKIEKRFKSYIKYKNFIDDITLEIPNIFQYNIIKHNKKLKIDSQTSPQIISIHYIPTKLTGKSKTIINYITKFI